MSTHYHKICKLLNFPDERDKKAFVNEYGSCGTRSMVTHLHTCHLCHYLEKDLYITSRPV